MKRNFYLGVLLGFTGFYWVLLGFTGFYWAVATVAPVSRMRVSVRDRLAVTRRKGVAASAAGRARCNKRQEEPASGNSVKRNSVSADVGPASKIAE